LHFRKAPKGESKPRLLQDWIKGFVLL